MSSNENLVSGVDLSALPPHIRGVVQTNIGQEDHQRHHRSDKTGCTKRRNKFHNRFHPHKRKKKGHKGH